MEVDRLDNDSPTKLLGWVYAGDLMSYKSVYLVFVRPDTEKKGFVSDQQITRPGKSSVH